ISTCIAACVEIGNQANPATKWTVTAQAGDELSVPLVHTDQLADGVYGERVRATGLTLNSSDGLVETPPGYKTMPAGFSGFHFFEVTSGHVAPLTNEAYQARIESTSATSSDPTRLMVQDQCMRVDDPSRTSCP